MVTVKGAYTVVYLGTMPEFNLQNSRFLDVLHQLARVVPTRARVAVAWAPVFRFRQGGAKGAEVAVLDRADGDGNSSAKEHPGGEVGDGVGVGVGVGKVERGEGVVVV